MSVVIVTPDHYETIRKTMRHLRAQTVRERLEIVIVVPSAKTLDPNESELREFRQIRVVEVGEMKSTTKARAAGIRQASAAVVVFVEDHSYPDAHWAEALIERHRQSWAAVGPDVYNANAESVVSWADVFLAGRQIAPAEAGVVNDLPGRNSSYKRAILLDYGTELESLIEMETILHWDLRARGHQLYLEPAAKVYHLNLARLSSFVQEQFYIGRLIAAFRARRWSPIRRLFYTVGAPFIPLVRLHRIGRELRRSNEKYGLLPGILPPLIIGLVASAAGEILGYALGAGSASQCLFRLEFHRDQQ